MTTPSPIKDQQIDIHRVGGNVVTVVPQHTPTGFFNLVKNVPGDILRVDLGTNLNTILPTIISTASIAADGGVATVHLATVAAGQRSQLIELQVAGLIPTYGYVYKNDGGSLTKRAPFQSNGKEPAKINYEAMGLYFDSDGNVKWTVEIFNVDKNSAGPVDVFAAEDITTTP